MNKALFLDRDGVINEDYGHVYKIEDFKFFNGIFNLCKKYQNKGYIIVVVSNQAGVAKKLYTVDDLNIIDTYMKEQFKKNGVTIADSFYCLHHPDDHCNCRKPMPGLFLQAKDKLDIDLENSVLIGDKMSDLIAGNRAGIKNLYFKKGKYPEEPVDFDYEVIEF